MNRLIVLVLVAMMAVLFSGCENNENVTISTQISEQITGQDSLLYASVRVQQTVGGPFGSDTQILDDALVLINGDTLDYQAELEMYQGELQNLNGSVTIDVTEGGTQHLHQVALERLTVIGLPAPGNGPIDPLFEVSWYPSDPTEEAQIDLYQLNGNEWDQIIDSSPIVVLVGGKFSGDSLRVQFSYDRALLYTSTFTDVTYYLIQTSDVLVR